MNITVIGVGYQCPNILQVLEPWFNLKKKSGLNINIIWSSAIFKDFGYTKFDNSRNAHLLKPYIDSNLIHYIETKEKQIKDYESRLIAWNYAQENNINTDYIFQLDGDEFYTEDDIKNAINFIQRNEFIETFRVCFKNYLGHFDNKYYVDDFRPLRVINNKTNKGFENFTWDNDGIFKNGKRTQEATCLIIPKIKTFPKHLSWCFWDDESFTRIRRKIDFQNKTLGCCSYMLKNGEMTFDGNYYSRMGVTIPIVYKDE